MAKKLKRNLSSNINQRDIMPRPQIVGKKVLAIIIQEKKVLKPVEIAKIGGLNPNNVRGILQRLLKKGLIQRVQRGKYQAK